MKCIGKSDIGRLRDMNEDSFYVSPGPVGVFERLFIVCDGMGGQDYGEVASALCVKTLVEFIAAAPMNMPLFIMEQAINEANLAVRKEAERLHSNNMGTTLVMAGVISGHVYIMNVGDSRLYLLNQYAFSIRQVTRDHSYVEEMVHRGLMSRDSEAYRKNKHVITRAIGVYREVEPDSFEIEMTEGDLLLLCSDGLSNMVNNMVMKNLALDQSFGLEKRVDTLILEANRSGGRDNITVILAECEEEDA